MSAFYRTDPSDPDAPVELENYYGLKPGMKVRYVNPQAPPIDEPLVINELIQFPGGEVVSAILNGGDWEVNADNLVEDV